MYPYALFRRDRFCRRGDAAALPRLERVRQLNFPAVALRVVQERLDREAHDVRRVQPSAHRQLFQSSAVFGVEAYAHGGLRAHLPPTMPAFPPPRKSFSALNLDKFRICGTMGHVLNA